MNKLEKLCRSCLSVFLALVMVFGYAGSCMRFISFADTGLSPVSLTYGEILTDIYSDKLNPLVQDVLLSGGLIDDTFEYIYPSAALLSVDAENRIISAGDYTDAKGNVWTKPATGTLYYGAGFTENITMGSPFAYTGDAYYAEALYSLYTSISKDEQLRLLNAAYYLAVGLNDLQYISDTEYVLEMIIDEYQTQLSALSYDAKVEILQNMIAYTEDFDAEPNKIDYLLSSDAEDFKAAVGEAASAINYLYVNISDPDSKSLLIAKGFTEAQITAVSEELKDLKDTYDAVYADPWTGHEIGSTLVADSSLINNFIVEYAYEIVFDDTITPFTESDITETILIDEYSDFVSTNRSSITVTVEAEVIENNTSVTKKLSAPVIKIDSSASAAEVKRAIEGVLSSFESGAISNWTAWNVGTQNYFRNASEMPSDASNSLEYTVSYTPKSYHVGGDYDEDLPYLYKLTLPTYSSENGGDGSQVYEYTVTGSSQKVVDEGRSITISEDITIEKSESPAEAKTDKGAIIAVSYSESDDFTALLSSYAFNTGSLQIMKPENKHNLVSFSDGNVYAEKYAANDLIDWQAVSVSFCDGDGNAVAAPVTTYTTVGDANVFAIPDEAAYEFVDVKYQLIINEASLSSSEVEDILLDAASVVDDANDQLDAMEILQSMESDLYTVHHYQDTTISGLMAAVKGQGGDATKVCCDDVTNNCINPETGNMYIYDCVLAMKDMSDAEKLAYFYKNYSVFMTSTTLANDLRTMASDQKILDIMEAMGKNVPAYLEKFAQISTSLDDAYAKMSAPSDRIVTTSNSDLVDFAGAALACTDVPAFDARAIKLETIVSASAPDKVALNLIVNVYDSKNALIDSLSAKETITYSFNDTDKYILQAGDEATILSKIEALSAAVAADGHYSTVDTVGPIPEELTSDKTITLNYYPNYYTVQFTEDGEVVGSASFPYGNQLTVELPASGDAAVRFEYTIDGVSGKTGTYTFTPNQIDDLFTGGVYQVERTKIDVEQDLIIKFVGSLNENYGEAYKQLTFMPLDSNGDGKADTILMRVCPKASDLNGFIDIMVDALRVIAANKIFPTINMETGDDSAETLLSSGQISLQTLIDVLLYSGIDADTFAELLDDQGYTKQSLGDNYTVLPSKVEYYHCDSDPGNQLGSVILDAGMGLTSSFTTNVRFMVSLEDFNSKTPLDDLVDMIEKIDDYVGFSLEDGRLNINIKSEKLYQAIVTAMTLTEYVSREDIASGNVSAQEVGMYLLTMLSNFFNEQDADGNYTATAENFQSTLDKVGIEIPYEKYASLAFKALAKFFRESNISELSIDPDSCGAAFYTNYYDFIIAAAKRADLGSVATPETIAALIMEYLESDKSINANANVNITVSGVGEHYTAAAFDIDSLKDISKGDGVISLAKAAANSYRFYKTNEITVNKGEGTYILILDDVDTLSVTNDCYLDLNGHAVGTLNSSAKVTVIDTTWANEGSIAELNVSDIVASAGTINGITEDQLPAGYVIEDGAIVNEFYRFVYDPSAPSLEIIVDADRILQLESTNEAALRVMAKDMLLDLLLNMYNVGSLTLDGNDIYHMDFFDYLGFVLDRRDLNEPIDSIIDAEGTANFLNEILAFIVNIDELSSAFESGDAEFEFSANTGFWNFAITGCDADQNDLGYFSFNTDSDTINETSVVLKIASENEFKNMVDDLYGKTITEASIISDTADIFASGKDITLYGEEELWFGFFSDDNNYVYVASLMIGEATGNTALVDAVADAVDTGNLAALRNELGTVTVSDVLETLVYYRTHEFADTAAGLSNESDLVELEAIYDDALRILGYAIEKTIGVDSGASRVFGDIEYAEDEDIYYGYYVCESTSSSQSVSKDIPYDASVTVKGNADITVLLYLFDWTVAVQDGDDLTYLGSTDLSQAFAYAIDDSDDIDGDTVVLNNFDASLIQTLDEDITISGKEVKLVHAEMMDINGKIFYLDGTDAKLTSDSELQLTDFAPTSDYEDSCEVEKIANDDGTYTYQLKEYQPDVIVEKSGEDSAPVYNDPNLENALEKALEDVNSDDENGEGAVLTLYSEQTLTQDAEITKNITIYANEQTLETDGYTFILTDEDTSLTTDLPLSENTDIVVGSGLDGKTVKKVAVDEEIGVYKYYVGTENEPSFDDGQDDITLKEGADTSVVAGVAAYKADDSDEEGILIIDVDPNGITADDLAANLQFYASNATAYELTAVDGSVATGKTVTLVASNDAGVTATVTYTLVVLGDTNDESKGNAIDCARIIADVKGTTTMSLYEVIAADINADGKYDAIDCARIVYKVKLWSTGDPATYSSMVETVRQNYIDGKYK